MAGERQTEPPPAATSATSSPAASETGSGGRRDQVSLRPKAAGAAVGEDDGKQEAGFPGGDAGLPAHGIRTTPDAPADDDVGSAESSEAVPATTQKGSLSLYDIEGHVLRAIRYHEARARFLDLCRRWLDFLVVLLGASAVSSAAQGNAFWTATIGITLAGIGALQLVAGFSERAGEHLSLKRRFCGVLARITEARAEEPISSRELAKITKRWAAIWADEPPTMHVLKAIAHNAARRTREAKLDEAELIEVGLWQSLTRNLSSWEGFEALTRAERAERAGKGDDSLRWWQRPRT